MVVTRTETVNLGPLERTSRAFYQEANEAIRGDIVRALVEYITNSDDAYQKKGGKGRILLEVEHRRGNEPWHARIRDRALGLSLVELRERIGRQGGRTSGFESGESVRGNLGLGAKDPACLGKVTFESIKDGEFAWLAIDDQGEVTASKRVVKADADTRTRLGLPGGNNGVVVTVEVTHPVPCPRHENLKQILRNHIQLRDILQDENREVSLLHANQPGSRPEALRFDAPKVTARINKKGLPVPGYPEFAADLQISESDEPFTDEGRRSVTRLSGLLIKGDHAIYESTLFGFESNPHAQAFTGSLRCAGIDQLARAFDDRIEKRIPPLVTNPMPIISRRREGLVEEHPFYQALRKVAEDELGPLVIEREKRVRERTRAVENAKTTKVLAELAKAAAKFMEETADEEEFDLPPTGPGAAPAPVLDIIPPALELTTGAQRTLTVIAAKAGLDGDAPEVHLDFQPPDIASSALDHVVLHPSRRRDDVFTATVKVSAARTLGVTLLTATLGVRSADCAIEVVEPETPPEPTPPAALEFERSRYRLVRGKPKSLLLRAPLGAYPEGTPIRVTSDERSVVVLEGGTATLKSMPDQLAMVAAVRVEGRTENITTRVTARDDRGRAATAEVNVVGREESGADFQIKLVDQMRGEQRAQWSTDYSVLEIMGEHPAVKPYLGRAEDNYPGQDLIQYRVLQAELVGDAVVRRMLQQKYGEDDVDVATIYVMHNRLVSKFMARAHRIIAASA